MVGFTGSQIVVVDLEKMKVRKQHDFGRERRLRFAATDDKSLFVNYQNSSQITQLDIDTLEQKSKKIFGGTINQIYLCGPSQIALRFTETNRRSAVGAVFDMTTMKQVKNHPESIGVARFYHSSQKLRLRRDGNKLAVADYFVYELDTAKIVAIRMNLPGIENFTAEPRRLNRGTSPIPQNSDQNSFANSMVCENWGRRLINSGNGTRLVDFAGRRLATTQCTQISADYPLLVGYYDERYDKNGRPKRDAVSTGCVYFHDLVSGKFIARIQLYRHDDVQGTQYRFQQIYYYRTRLDVHGRHVFVFDERNNFYKTAIPETVIKKLEAPFRLQQPAVVSADLTKKTTVQLKAVGADEIQYKLEYALPGVNVDSKTGLLTIDGPTIWKTILERKTSDLGLALNRGVIHRSVVSPKQPQDLVKHIGAPDGKAYFNLPIHVSAQSDGEATDSRIFFVIGYGDKKQLDTVVAEAEKKRQQEREKRLVEQRKQMEELRAEQAKSAETRVAELEEQVARLEALFDKVQTRLDKMLKEMDKSKK